jgi:hypothetical protein
MVFWTCSGQFSTQPGCPAAWANLDSYAVIVNSECASRNLATVPSFSSGENVHVEYTKRPPGLTMSAAESNILV